ncbi:MAG: DUF1353 domain-containing protein [Hyphomicrobiales bacterium]|nr:DUF1353 domain-containing protein [Hyphomicrobiales bacterium]MCC2103799.1 DUF1353 domain-containing protein [Hyphomicrobiales bacterium]MCC2106292.1 DUF1353 domain-containing protein [Hyphomicrobiales bacterium]
MAVGKFTGSIVVTLLDDGRYVQLMQPVSYIDCAGLSWNVPTNAKLDGASIPKPLWSLIGGPFEGKYRNASVFHDWYCDTRERPWQAVHRMFYEAMLTAGVGTVLAKIMYAGVYWGGPRWPPATSENIAVLREAITKAVPNTLQHVVKNLNDVQRGPMGNLDSIALGRMRSAFPDRLEVGPLNGSIQFYPDHGDALVPADAAISPAKNDLASFTFSRTFSNEDVEALQNEIGATPDLSLDAIDSLVDRRSLKTENAEWEVKVQPPAIMPMPD